MKVYHSTSFNPCVLQKGLTEALQLTAKRKLGQPTARIMQGSIRTKIQVKSQDLQ